MQCHKSVGQLWKRSTKCSLSPFQSSIYRWKQWSAISTSWGFFLAKWRFKHSFLLNLGKFCFDFRGLQQTACPALLLGVCCQSLLLQGGTLSVGINLHQSFHKWLTYPQAPVGAHLAECAGCHLSHSWASLQNWYLTTPGKTTEPQVTDFFFLHW